MFSDGNLQCLDDDDRDDDGYGGDDRDDDGDGDGYSGDDGDGNGDEDGYGGDDGCDGRSVACASDAIWIDTG